MKALGNKLGRPKTTLCSGLASSEIRVTECLDILHHSSGVQVRRAIAGEGWEREDTKPTKEYVKKG